MSTVQPGSRLDYLDATRAFALVLGIVFHASLSFMPTFIFWAVQDVSTSPLVAMSVVVSHSFRMETFFLLAGFFGWMTFHRQGATVFIRSRAVRILVPFVVGWFVLRPLIVSGWIMGGASLRGDVDVWAGLEAGFASLSTLPAGIFTGSHLWFLYYLAMITALVLAIRGILARCGPAYAGLARGADVVVTRLASSRLAVVLLAAPTAVALWQMRFWGMDTPDTSLRPHIPVLAVYGGCFVLGWLIARRSEAIVGLTRLSLDCWILAAAGITGSLLLIGIERNPSHPHYTLAHVGFVASYAVMMWSLVFLTIGLFRKLCSRPNPVVRYIADSSYWLYLVHLPIVVWLQVAVAEAPLHWSLKLAFVSGATIAVSLLTYDLFVRSTIVGQVLNGRRKRRILTPARLLRRKVGSRVEGFVG